MSATLDFAFLHVCWITIMHTMYKYRIVLIDCIVLY